MKRLLTYSVLAMILAGPTGCRSGGFLASWRERCFLRHDDVEYCEPACDSCEAGPIWEGPIYDEASYGGVIYEPGRPTYVAPPAEALPAPK